MAIDAFSNWALAFRSNLSMNGIGLAWVRSLFLSFLFSIAVFTPAVCLAQTGNTRVAEIHDHLRKAADYLRTNNPAAAAQEFSAVLKLDPKNAEAYANLGVIAFFQRDYKNASQYLQKALSIDPSLSKTEALLGICQRRLGDPAAQATLEKSFPRLKDKNLAIQAGLELANIDYQQGNLDRAASVMRALVDLDPDNVEILYMAQRVYSELADDTLNKLSIIAPASARMQQIIAERLINEGNLKDAIAHYRKCLEIDPRVPGIRYELAQAIFDSAPSDPAAQAEAKKELEEAQRVEGDSAQIESELAKIALRESDQKSAFDHYSRAFALDPHQVEAELGIARMLMSSDKPREALKYLRMAVESDPLNSEAHYRLSRVYKSLDMNEDAQKESHLFQEIKDAQAQIRELYRQMNKRPNIKDDQLTDLPQ